jgi:hypothetical protein
MKRLAVVEDRVQKSMIAPIRMAMVAVALLVSACSTAYRVNRAYQQHDQLVVLTSATYKRNAISADEAMKCFWGIYDAKGHLAAASSSTDRADSKAQLRDARNELNSVAKFLRDKR